MSGLPSYQVIRSKKRRKTMSLRVKEDGKIAIHVPYQTTQEEIERFIDKSRSWVSKKLLERERSTKEANRVYAPGEKFFYLGEAYPLSIEANSDMKQPLRLSFGKFILDGTRVHEARDLFARWYRAEAERMLKERVDHYSHKLHLFPKGVRITSARVHWGSCSGDNRLSFSWRIMMAPLKVIDYILIHELIHIKEKNHSKRFWSHLEFIVSDYKKQRIWLKEHGSSFPLLP